MINVSHFVIDWGWLIRLEKITPIPHNGATCIVSGPRCTIESFCSKLVGGCRKCGYGYGDGIRHQTPFVANPQFEVILQSMENDVDKSAEYNAFRLAQYEYIMYPN